MISIYIVIYKVECGTVQAGMKKNPQWEKKKHSLLRDSAGKNGKNKNEIGAT